MISLITTSCIMYVFYSDKRCIIDISLLTQCQLIIHIQLITMTTTNNKTISCVVTKILLMKYLSPYYNILF